MIVPKKRPLIVIAFFGIIAMNSCSMAVKQQKNKRPSDLVPDSITADRFIETDAIIDSTKIALGFDFPVGKPDGHGYYDYQGFTKNNHLGEDWNGIGGSNTDLGDIIYAIGNGKVVYAEDFRGGWGNTIRIVHTLPNGLEYESVYAHCDTLLTRAEQWVGKGEAIGTIGTAHGQYLAHLHLEIRDEIGLPIGEGYSADTTGYVNPTAFIRNHRHIPAAIQRNSTLLQ